MINYLMINKINIYYLITMYFFHFFIMFIYTIKIIKWQQLKTMFLIK
jgi:hypothetical protein